ncbi:hypothetical protein G6F47_012921 [Rhizopus delemar]|nr:hypothetical protein G6F47_012921 [Rhizopus delemar]
MLEDINDDDDDVIPIPNINGKILNKVIEWCEYHKKDFNNEDNEDQETLFDIILASNYLDIKQLLDLGCKTVANMIKEEESQIKKENEWAEDR